MPTVTLSWLLEVPAPELPPAPPDVPARDNYTDDEVSAAVGKLVQGAIRRPYGILGERKTLDTFDDTMDAAAGVFILTPNSPFYVLLLGSRRLSDFTTSTISTAADLMAAIENTGRRVKPLTNLTSLGNARTALAALEAATAARDSTFDDISQAPAFQRFDRHTDRFLSDAAANIRVGTDIAQTPQEARQRLAGFVTELTAATADILRRVGLLSVGIEDYNSLNLPALLSQGVISRAKTVLQDRIDQLEPLTPAARLQHLRDTTLDVLASKAVVKGFGSLTKSGEFIPIEGTAQTFADADHLAKAAVIESEKLDPYVVLTGADELVFTVEAGDAVCTVPLPKSFIAKMEGTAKEPFNIQVGVNDFLDVDVEGFGDVDVTFNAGAARTAAQIRDEFNAAQTTEPIVAETFLNPPKYIGIVSITGTDPNMVFTAGAGVNFVSLGVDVGDGLIVDSGDNYQLYFVISSRTATVINAVRSTPGTAVAEANQTVHVGPPGRYIRFRISDAGVAAAVAASRQIRIDDEDAVVPTANTLGFVAGQSSRCRRTRAEDIALSINTSPLASALGVPRVKATSVFVPSTFQGQQTLTGRTEPTNAVLVVSSVYRVRDAAITNVGPSPAHFAVSGALSAGVVVGDRLTLRAAAVSNQVGIRGTVTVVTDTEVRATLNGTVTLQSGVDLEFGRNIDVARDGVVRILSPSPIAGDYRCFGELLNPTELDIDRPLPVFIGQGGQPLTFQMQVGAYRVDFETLDRTVDSQLEIDGTAATLFFVGPPVENIGSTRFVLFEKDPRVLGVGDRLELYTGQYDEPEYTFGITGFELGQKLIEVDGDIPISWIELDFTVAIDSPFARVRRVARNNYDDFKVQLGLWSDQGIGDTQYFRDLNRFLNPLIVNENPSLSAVNDAKLHVQTLAQALNQLQVVLAGYEVETVPRVDTLIESFLSKGSDRAVDTLLEGRFSEFFGYNSQEVSYLGNSLERLRDVSRLDLPVRRTARKEVVDQELTVAQFEEPNFEYDQSDTQDTDEPDIPLPFVEISGGNF